MNWYKRYLIAEKVQKDDSNFSWIYIDIPKDIKKIQKDIQKEIDEEDIYKIDKGDGKWNYGLEDDPHITVKYGIDFDEPDKIIEILDDENGGIVDIDSTEIFDNEKYDVLVIKCKSKDLARLNKKLTEDLKIEDSHPVYIPHITIGYLKKGKGKEYKDISDKYLKDKKFKFTEVFFEDRNDKNTKICLEKK